MTDRIERLRRRTSVLVCAALASVAVAPVARGQREAPAAAIDVEKLGPQVGSKVPDFSLPDQSGRVRTLQSIVGPKGAVLVFFRSADW